MGPTLKEERESIEYIFFTVESKSKLKNTARLMYTYRSI